MSACDSACSGGGASEPQRPGLGSLHKVLDADVAELLPQLLVALDSDGLAAVARSLVARAPIREGGPP